MSYQIQHNLSHKAVSLQDFFFCLTRHFLHRNFKEVTDFLLLYCLFYEYM